MQDLTAGIKRRRLEEDAPAGAHAGGSGSGSACATAPEHAGGSESAKVHFFCKLRN